MKTKHSFRIILTVLGATAAGSLAYAQTMQMPTGEGNKGCPMMSTMDDGGMARMMGQGMMGSGSTVARVEGRLAFLKAELAITEAQAPTWKQYEDAVRSRTSAMQGMRQDMMKAMQSRSVADRVKARIAMMEGMVANMKAQGTAIETLYTVLTDEQKKKGDELLGVGMM
jgi:hypothetical protein